MCNQQSTGNPPVAHASSPHPLAITTEAITAAIRAANRRSTEAFAWTLNQLGQAVARRMA